MDERIQSGTNPESLLLDTSEKCAALARLLRRTDCGTDADILAQGAAVFSQIDRFKVGEKLAMEVISRSFGEDGPRLPTLVRGIIDLSQCREDPDAASKAEKVSRTHRSDVFSQTRAGNIKCILDEQGGYMATVNEFGAGWINNFSKPPFDFGRHDGDFRYRSFSPYYKMQQVITEAFFVHKDGTFLLPDLSDVFVYSVGEYRKIKCLYESRLFLVSRHFLKHAGQLIYKIRHLEELQPKDFKGWKKFKDTMDKVTMEYKEVAGRQITADDLVKIALREQTDLHSL